jgi:hypothetical protein
LVKVDTLIGALLSTFIWSVLIVFKDYKDAIRLQDFRPMRMKSFKGGKIFNL